MGADLYIKSLYERQREKYKPNFDAWVKVRQQATTDEDREKAQEQVMKYFNKMYKRGYFRDAYNDSNLLWQFELSWWSSVVPLLDEDGNLSLDNVQWLLQELEKREPIFELNLKKQDARWRKYFRKKYQALRVLLRQAIDCNQPIRCSL
ncbi:MAG: hypothetical protein EPO21_22070 [Chloroflexota bacterium]|nr:MAG: hypothetical protein EPO21_22070 [Chloroflexota bacterium]